MSYLTLTPYLVIRIQFTVICNNWYSLTVHLWATVLDPRHKHGRGINLLTTVRATLLQQVVICPLSICQQGSCSGKCNVTCGNSNHFSMITIVRVTHCILCQQCLIHEFMSHRGECFKRKFKITHSSELLFHSKQHFNSFRVPDSLKHTNFSGILFHLYFTSHRLI